MAYVLLMLALQICDPVKVFVLMEAGNLPLQDTPLLRGCRNRSPTDTHSSDYNNETYIIGTKGTVHTRRFAGYPGPIHVEVWRADGKLHLSPRSFRGAVFHQRSRGPLNTSLEEIKESVDKAKLGKPSQINGSDDQYNQIPNGTILCYITNENRYGKLKVLEYGYNMIVRRGWRRLL